MPPPLHLLDCTTRVVLLGLIGAIADAGRWPGPWPKRLGHQEVWHFVVLAGAAVHCAFNFTLLGFVCPPL